MKRKRPIRTHHLPRLAILLVAASAISSCDQPSRAAPNDGEEIQERARETQMPQRRTGAELQDHALNRVVRALYLCDNGDRLSVDFDNPRMMATVRNSMGEAVDLHQERAAAGIWYRASGSELRGKGDTASWTADGQPTTECRAID
ncbi:MliC family protein [Brevundimonas sp.]|uniref:MliC family protein n=1 Tax=Brevundimonas sp. TaxID=1871086 RepID=UPI003A949E00